LLMWNWRNSQELTFAQKQEKLAAFGSRHAELAEVQEKKSLAMFEIDRQVQANKSNLANIQALYPKSVLDARPVEPGRWPVWLRLVVVNGSLALLGVAVFLVHRFIKKRKTDQASSS